MAVSPGEVERRQTVTLLTDFRRVDRRHGCPICGRSNWCLVSRDNPADPARVICARVESSRRWGDAGWLHERHKRDVRPMKRSRTRTIRVSSQSASPDGLGELAASFRAAVRDTDLRHLADDLNVSIESLKRLGIGWNGWACSFPMTDANGTVRGIRLRMRDGRKLAVRGSRDGLFIPAALSAGDRLFIAEGPTDTAALLDFSFSAIGRPSCQGATNVTAQFVRRQCAPEIVIVADADEAGRVGALRLARHLLRYRVIKILAPPAGIKDVREWKRRSATREDLLDAVHRAASCEIRVRTAPQCIGSRDGC